jgi:hypothetical protein
LVGKLRHSLVEHRELIWSFGILMIGLDLFSKGSIGSMLEHWMIPDRMARE